MGAPCAFPFNYRGSLRHSCAPTSDAPDAVHWCPREVDSYGDCVENIDGRCIAGECRWGCTQAIPRRSLRDYGVVDVWFHHDYMPIIYRCRDFARRRTSSLRRQPRAPRLNARTAALPPHRARWLWAAPSLRAAMMGFVTARSTGWCCTLRRQQQQLAQQQHKNNKPAAPHKRGTAGGLTHREHLATWRIGPPPLPR